MYLKTAIRFDPETGRMEMQSEINNPKALVTMLLAAASTIVNQPAEQPRIVVPPPGVVVPG